MVAAMDDLKSNKAKNVPAFLSSEVRAAYNRQRPPALQKRLCFAPFSSLYFSRNGDILACCYNRKFVLARYPADNLLGAWCGEEAQKMRQAMMGKALPAGCSSCQEQFKAANFSNVLARNYDRYANLPFPQAPLRLGSALFAAPFPRAFFQQLKAEARQLKYGRIRAASPPDMPRLMEFELSNTCNLECAFCFGEFSSSIRRNRDQLPAFPELYNADFVEELQPFLPHLWEAKFLGGEPFLIPLYFEIWAAIRKLNPGIRVHITSNGTVLNQKVIAALEGLKVSLILSIDSFEEDTFENIRKNAKFGQVMTNLQYFSRLARQKGSRLTLAVSPCILNAWEIPAIVARCNQEGWYVHFNTVWWPEELSLRRLPVQELDRLIHHYVQFRTHLNTKVKRQNANALSGLCNQLKLWSKNAGSYWTQK